MPTNTKEYMNVYMKAYMVKHKEHVTCDICNKKYKKYRIYMHVKSQYHQKKADEEIRKFQ